MDISQIKPYTRTIIIATNWKIDIQRLYELLPITPHVIQPKKRGRKKKGVVPEPQVQLAPGSIITLKLPPYRVRGVNPKGTGAFGNNLTIVIKIRDKLINFKLPVTGKLQFTGCQDPNYIVETIQHLFKHIDRIERKHGGKILEVLPGPFKSPTMIAYQMMINIKFDLGFTLNREKLDDFLNKNTQNFFSFVENSLNYAGAAVTLPVEMPDNFQVVRYRFIDKTWRKSQVPFEQFLSLLSEKDVIKEKKREKKMTFLVFDSGIAILSAPFEQLIPDAYEEFYYTLQMNKHLFMKNNEITHEE